MQYRLAEDYYRKLGLIEIDGNTYKVDNLPKGLKVKGDLRLSDRNLTSLPEGLKVGRDLYCYSNQLTSLPKGLKVGGNLYCSHNQLTSLPEGLKVGGNLDCRFNNFPKGYVISDSVEIGGRIIGLD